MNRESDEAAASMFESLAAEAGEPIEVRRQETRFFGAEVVAAAVYKAVVFFANVGGAIAFFQICRSFLDRQSRYDVAVVYRDRNGTKRETTLRGVSLEETSRWVEDHGVDGAQGVLVRILRKV